MWNIQNHCDKNNNENVLMKILLIEYTFVFNVRMKIIKPSRKEM